HDYTLTWPSESAFMRAWMPSLFPRPRGKRGRGDMVGDKLVSGYEMLPRGAPDSTFIVSRDERRCFVRNFLISHYRTTTWTVIGAAARTRVAPCLGSPVSRRPRTFEAPTGPAVVSRKGAP